MPYIYRHDITLYLFFIHTKLYRDMTSMGDCNGSRINPRHPIGMRVGNGGESKPLYILNKNHICATSTVNDDSVVFLSILGKGIKDGYPSPILF